MASTGPSAGSSPYAIRNTEALPATVGAALVASGGTFIGISGSTREAVVANAHSGNTQWPAMGFALQGARWGTWTQKAAEVYDVIDSPMGIGQVNSGVWVVGLPLFLSGTGAFNFSQTPPTTPGTIFQMVGVMISPTRFRIKIGQPFMLSGTAATAGSLLRPWYGPSAFV
jgi:hypothetical protein